MTNPNKPNPGPVAASHSLAQEHLRAALEAIDAELGEGEARKNPQLVAAFMQSCSIGLAADAIATSLAKLALPLSKDR